METDETLYERARAGDLTAFDGLYARYERKVFGFLLRQLQDRSRAEEVLHDVFVQVLKASGVRFTDARFSAWLFRVARNLAANHLRTSSRASAALARVSRDAPDASTPLDSLLEEERAFALSRAVARLPRPLADVFHLRSSGLSYLEIAEALDLPLGTVKSRLNSLTHQLSEELHE